jgi:hypothetical protein
MLVNPPEATPMKQTLNKLFSKRFLTVIVAAVLILSVLNTYLILDGTRTAMITSVVNYDFVLSHDGEGYKLKNMLTGYVTTPQSASDALNTALSEGKSVYLNAGTYSLTGDVHITNKLNGKIGSDGAVIEGNGYSIVVYGDSYTASQYIQISGLTLISATLHVENSFATTVTDTKFINCSTALEFINTNTWSEYNKIENCQFINNTESIAFRTPEGKDATGSYASSTITRCSFNLQDNAVGIKVESLAEFTDSQLQNVRFWLGEGPHTNQVALRVDGTMKQTLLFGVVFESFTEDPVNIFAIDLGETCEGAPIIDDGVSFLGNWTSRVHNPYGIWVGGVGSVFKLESTSVPVGTSGQFGGNVTIETYANNVHTFKPKITVHGNFHDESVVVRIRIEYIDNVMSNSLTKTFTNSSSIWLSDDEILSLLPSQSIVWSIIVDAKTAASSTDVRVDVSGYGTTG